MTLCPGALDQPQGHQRLDRGVLGLHQPDGVYFLGNAPSHTNNATLFDGDNNATVYYLPGAAGWEATFDGLPTVLWLI
jgi:hypothetical protein